MTAVCVMHRCEAVVLEETTRPYRRTHLAGDSHWAALLLLGERDDAGDSRVTLEDSDSLDAVGGSSVDGVEALKTRCGIMSLHVWSGVSMHTLAGAVSPRVLTLTIVAM